MKRSPLGVVTEATIYARISYDPLNLGVGVDNQIEACTEFCEKMGWKVGRIFVDNDRSATTGEARPEFEALLASNPQVVVVWHTDRLVRVTRDLERVIELGVNVHAIKAGHLDLSTPSGRAVARTVTAWATYEGEQKAERQRLAAARRAKDGEKWWPRRPFGLEMNGKLRADEAAALKKAYLDLLAGVPLARLARDLNEAGFRTNRDKLWTGVTLRPVLLNPRNAGIRAYWGEEIGKANWDAIVDEDIYRQAVRKLTDPDRYAGGGGRSPKNLLVSIARCGKCGALANTKIARGKTKYPVYACRKSSCFTLPVDWADQYVTEHAIQVLSSPAAEAVWATGEDPSIELRAEAVSLREKLSALAEDYASDLITRAAMLAGTERARAKLAEVEKALSQIDPSGPLNGLRGDEQEVRLRWGGLSLERRRAAISALFPIIRFMPKGRGVRTYRPEHVRFTDEQEEAPELVVAN